MPPTNTDEGLAAAEAIRAHHPAVGVLVLSQYVEASYALRLMDAGEGHCGYLLKDRVLDAGELVSAWSASPQARGLSTTSSSRSCSPAVGIRTRSAS